MLNLYEVLVPHEHEVQRDDGSKDDIFVIGKIHGGFCGKNAKH